MTKVDVKQRLVTELHKPTRINFIRRNVIIKGLNETLQADLVEMIPYSKENRQHKYILVVIDVFSKYVWAVAVKNKSAKDVTEAMHTILKKIQPKPKNIHTDLGKEFYNSLFGELMKKYSINHYSTFSVKKASIVERVNRTLKSAMWKVFSYQGSYKWLEVLPKIVDKYNSTIHSTIHMKPKDVNKKNERQLLKTAYNKIKKVDLNSIKYKVGDKVRLSKQRSIFHKGYMPKWTTEVFTVKEIKLTNPITYHLQDQHGEIIRGGFYKEELQPAKYPDIYLVEKVIRKNGNKLYVKWLGFDATHNSWINKSDIA